MAKSQEALRRVSGLRVGGAVMILTWKMDPDHSPLLSLKLGPRIPEKLHTIVFVLSLCMGVFCLSQPRHYKVQY